MAIFPEIALTPKSKNISYYTIDSSKLFDSIDFVLFIFARLNKIVQNKIPGFIKILISDIPVLSQWIT